MTAMTTVLSIERRVVSMMSLFSWCPCQSPDHPDGQWVRLGLPRDLRTPTQPAERLTLSVQGIRARRLRMLNAYSPPAPYRRSTTSGVAPWRVLRPLICHCSVIWEIVAVPVLFFLFKGVFAALLAFLGLCLRVKVRRSLCLSRD